MVTSIIPGTGIAVGDKCNIELDLNSCQWLQQKQILSTTMNFCDLNSFLIDYIL